MKYESCTRCRRPVIPNASEYMLRGGAVCTCTIAPRGARMPAEPPPEPKRSKYGNKKEVVDGETFDSRKEAARYRELKLMQAAGEITCLGVHPKYVFNINGEPIGTYHPDFAYVKDGNLIVEDVKSSATRTEAYRLRKKLMKALHGIDVQEI